MLLNNLNTYYYVRNSKTEGKKGTLYVRVSVNNRILTVNSIKNIQIEADKFDSKKQMPMPGCTNGYITKLFMNEVEKVLNTMHIVHEQKGQMLTKQSIKMALTGAATKVRGDLLKHPTFISTFDDYLCEMENLIGKSISMSTYQVRKRYRIFAEKVLKQLDLNDMPIVNITSEDVRKFQDQLIINDYAIGTVERSMATFKRVFEHGVDKGWLASSPARNVKIKREVESDRPLPLYLEQHELKKLTDLKLEGLFEQVRDMFVFCAWTGLAVGDYALINPATRDRLINQAMSPKNIVPPRIEKTNEGLFLMGRRRKTATEYRVPLHPEALKIIAKYGGIDYLPMRLAKTTPILAGLMLLIKVKKPITFHSARKTFANYLLNNKMMDPYYAIQMTGWKSIDQAKPYVKVQPSTLHRALFGEKEEVKPQNQSVKKNFKNRKRNNKK
jgi:site-specific recombinase XerD